MNAKTLETHLTRLGELLRITLQAEQEAYTIAAILNKEVEFPEDWGGSDDNQQLIDYWLDYTGQASWDHPEDVKTLTDEWMKSVKEMVEVHTRREAALSKLTKADRLALGIKK